MDLGLIVSRVRTQLNTQLRGTEPAVIVAVTAAACLLATSFVTVLRGNPRNWKLSLWQRFKSGVFRLMWKIGPLKAYKSKSLASARASLAKAFKPTPEEVAYIRLPEVGLKADEVMTIMNRRSKEMSAFYESHHHLSWDKKRITGTVYHGGKVLTQLVGDAIKATLWSNPLHPQTFPDVRKMDAEIVAMAISLYKGHVVPDPASPQYGPRPLLPGTEHDDDGACGFTTSGGTESILMAVRAYREWAADVKGITRPELVAPVSAHAAFAKACDYFNVKLISVPTLRTGHADVNAMRRAITSNTIALVGSAPSYPYGVADDVPALAALAAKRGVGFHVDACLGSFMAPFLRELGYTEFPPCDFSVPGVTSVSCDTHKYGFGPKGMSVLMFSSNHLRRYAYFAATEWPGGVYVTPAISGSRPGAQVAGTWAAMMHVGVNGYRDAARLVAATVRKIVDATATIPGIVIPTTPAGHECTPSYGLALVVPLASNSFDIFALGERLAGRGWELATLLFPPALHFGVTYLHTDGDVADAFIKDVRECAEALMALPEAERRPGESLRLYASSQAVPDRAVVQAFAMSYVDSQYASAYAGAAVSPSAQPRA